MAKWKRVSKIERWRERERVVERESECRRIKERGCDGRKLGDGGDYWRRENTHAHTHAH